MKALITAGGHATRLRPITYTTNKHLIPVANKPLIFYALEKFADTEIKEVAINVNKGEVKLKEAVGDGSRWGLKITYIEQKGGALGVAHVIKNARTFLGDDDFVFYLGDNIILGSIHDFINKFKNDKLNCLLALSKVRDPQRFGVPQIDENGRIISVEEKPSDPKSEYAVAGIYVYDKTIHAAVDSLKPSSRGELEISEAHQYFIDHGKKVGYSVITGWWKDTGKPYDLLEGNQLILNSITEDIKGTVDKGVDIQGRVVIGEGSRIEGRSFIRGPVHIGKNTIIRGSYIGPYTSIGDRVEIIGTEIEHSIVFDEADIECNRRIVDSILGRNCTISNSFNTYPRGHKIIAGDNSQIEL